MRFGMPSALCAFATGVWLRSNAGMHNRTPGYAAGHRFAVRRFAEPLSPRISYSVVIIIVDSPTTSTCELVALWLAWLVQGNESPKKIFV